MEGSNETLEYSTMYSGLYDRPTRSTYKSRRSRSLFLKKKRVPPPLPPRKTDTSVRYTSDDGHTCVGVVCYDNNEFEYRKNEVDDMYDSDEYEEGFDFLATWKNKSDVDSDMVSITSSEVPPPPYTLPRSDTSDEAGREVVEADRKVMEAANPLFCEPSPNPKTEKTKSARKNSSFQVVKKRLNMKSSIFKSVLLRGLKPVKKKDKKEAAKKDKGGGICLDELVKRSNQLKRVDIFPGRNGKQERRSSLERAIKTGASRLKKTVRHSRKRRSEKEDSFKSFLKQRANGLKKVEREQKGKSTRKKSSMLSASLKRAFSKRRQSGGEYCADDVGMGTTLSLGSKLSWSTTSDDESEYSLGQYSSASSNEDFSGNLESTLMRRAQNFQAKKKYHPK